MRPLTDILRLAKNRMGEMWWYTLMLFIASRFGDVINVFIGLWLVPRYVSTDDLGALLPLTQVSSLVGLPLAILLTPFTKYVNTFIARKELGKARALLQDAAVLIVVLSVVVVAQTFFSAHFFFERLRVYSYKLIWILAGVSVTAMVLPLAQGVLSALKRFNLLSLSSYLSAPTRFVVLLVLLPISGILGFFCAQFAMNAVIIAIALWGVAFLFKSGIRRESYRSSRREMFLYTLPFVLYISVTTLATSVQLIIIRQRLPNIESAAYYFISRFAEIPVLVWSSVAAVFFPSVSEAFEQGRDTLHSLRNVMLVSCLLGAAIAAAVGVAMPFLFRAVPAWNQYVPYVYLTGWMAFVNVLRAGFCCYSVYETACRRFSFLWFTVPISLLQSVFLICFTGYTYFVPYLPASVVEWMGGLHIARLPVIIGVFFVTDLLIFLISLGQITWRRRKA
jgi:O-antigen/teichoic acid export membrane protein